MSLSELIRFCKLNKELTDIEFFGQFCKSIGREKIVSLLYEDFKNDLDATKLATKIQTNILRKREEIEDEQSSYDCIDQLPYDCVSEVASWLEYRDYFHFAHCNRTIYYSVYSPSKIHNFELMDKSCDNLTLFKNVYSLKMNIYFFNRLSLLGRSTWKNNKSLRTLHLFSTGLVRNRAVKFLNNIHLINTDHVCHLILSNMHHEETLYEILSKFGSIEHLCIDGEKVYHQIHIDNSNYVKCGDLELNNLKHLKVELSVCSSIRGLPSLIGPVCHQLESLKFDGTLKDDTIFPTLKLFECDKWNDSYSKAFKKTTTLESIKINFLYPDCIDPLFELVSKQRSLKKLTLCSKWCDSYWYLDSIEEALNKYDGAVEGMERVSIELHGSNLMGKNEAFGAQICRLYKLWESEAFGLKMTINCTNIDMGNAGLSALDEVDSYCSVSWKQNEAGNGYKIEFSSDLSDF